MAGATQIPDVISDGVDEVDGFAVVLPGKSEDALRQGDAEAVRPHVVEAVRLLLLKRSRNVIYILHELEFSLYSVSPNIVPKHQCKIKITVCNRCQRER